MNVLSITKNEIGFSRIEAIDSLLQKLGEDDRRRALACLLRIEVYHERLAMESGTEKGITEETRILFKEEVELLCSLFTYLYKRKAKKEWATFVNIYFST